MVAPLVGASLIGLGGNLLGGLFGRKQQKDALAFERQRIQMTVNDAKAAGIHPLAALGVSSSYQNPYGGNPIGDAVASGASRVAENVAQKPIAAAQLRVLNSEAARNEAEAQAIRAEAQSRTLIARARASAQAGVTSTPLVGPETIVTPAGAHRTSATSAQQEVEDQYGGIAGEGYGLWRLLNDTLVRRAKEVNARDMAAIEASKTRPAPKGYRWSKTPPSDYPLYWGE